MERMSAINLAIENEHTEMQYYLQQAARSGNPVIKVLFETLAADEKEHMERIQALHAKLTTDGQWPQDLPISVDGTDIIDRVNKLKKETGTTSTHDDNDIAALEKAAAGEAEGAKFYAELAENCDNVQEKKFFTFLSNIEREHLLSIKDSIFYLEDPAAWLEEKSRSGLDGA